MSDDTKTREELVNAAYENYMASSSEELNALRGQINESLKRVRTIQETAMRNAMRAGQEEFGG